MNNKCIDCYHYWPDSVNSGTCQKTKEEMCNTDTCDNFKSDKVSDNEKTYGASFGMGY